jgi:hypothetical protein
MSDDEQVAILAAQYLKQIFRSKGLIPLKVEILLPAHSMDSVRATYKAWFVGLDDSFDDPRQTISWEEGVAHFFREGDCHFFQEGERGVWRVNFTPKKDCKWEHNYNAVIRSGQCEVADPDVDEDAAKEWSRLQLPRVWSATLEGPARSRHLRA